jgi:hypothetical protein
MRWGVEKCIYDFYRKAEGKRSLERPRRRWEENIKMAFKKHMLGCLGFG